MRVWYAAYGSNLSRHRFLTYLQGGTAAGARRTQTGARDPQPPTGDRPVHLPGRLHFGWESVTWGGGIAFYVPGEDPRGVAARAYLLTAEQFVDVAAQEMHREPRGRLDLSRVLAEGYDVAGPGRYETIHRVGTIEDLPVLTFTAEDVDALGSLAPTAPYLRTIAEGLRESHGMGEEAVVDYLRSSPAVREAWSRPDLLEVLGAPM
ncbi:histone deacetylase [uncultured Serinicoccus sp.]|uniref:histone deacetylase n=1 Tax=uncultured Serinicoccus sp. TaxID=735514 RepID=UPI00263461B8|nr:histone deacetylase [uncultured Serinicoccus sp.]